MKQRFCLLLVMICYVCLNMDRVNNLIVALAAAVSADGGTT